MIGGSEGDVLEGGKGDDRLNARDGVSHNDTVDGGPGRDTCAADQRDLVDGCP